MPAFVGPDSSMVEQLTFNQLVRGSSPRPATSNRLFTPPKGLLIYVRLHLKFFPQVALIHVPLSGWIAQW
jgi:hypothetical protein